MRLRIITEPKKEKPNWKEPKDYDSMNNLTLSQWAWEFLKRNRKYIEKWKMLTKDLSEDQLIKNPPLFVTPGGFGSGLYGAHRWGIAGPYLNPDPSFVYSEIPFKPFAVENFFGFISSTDREITTLGPPDYETGEAIFKFNFNQPIIPQIEFAKKELLKFQTESKKKDNKVRKAFKPRRDEWILLIRILDAMASGAKDKEIAAVLFPNKCPVDETANGCPLDKTMDKYILDDEAASKCPLGEGASSQKCPFEDPAAGFKRVHDKKKQALKYINQDYRSIPYSEI